MNILKVVCKYLKYGLVRGNLKYLQMSSESSLIFSVVGLEHNGVVYVFIF